MRYRKPNIILFIYWIKLMYHVIKVDYSHGDIDEYTFTVMKWWLLRKLAKHRKNGK